MNTTHDDTATTWRDLSDQLTERQIAEFTQHEAAYPDERKYMLMEARSYAEQNLNDRLHFGHIEKPEGATKTYLAEQSADGRWFREFAGTSRVVAGVTVYLDGKQFADGTVARELTIGVDDLPSGPGGRVSSAEARAIAARLVEAADELDRLNA